MTGIAMYYQADALLQKGQPQEAQAVLQKPVEGAGSGAVRVGLLSLLSVSYQQAGDVEQAQRAATEAVAAYKSLKEPPKGEGLEYQEQRAEQVLAWCQQNKAKLK